MSLRISQFQRQKNLGHFGINDLKFVWEFCLNWMRNQKVVSPCQYRGIPIIMMVSLLSYPDNGNVYTGKDGLYFETGSRYPSIIAHQGAPGSWFNKRCHLTSIGNLIVDIRQSYDRLISTMEFPILVRWHLYIGSGPWINIWTVWEKEFWLCNSHSNQGFHH